MMPDYSIERGLNHSRIAGIDEVGRGPWAGPVTDTRSASIAAASIVAKVHRDALMRDLASEFPAYGWETNRGYGTQKHQVSLLSHGPTLHHRRSFKPIHNMLYPPKS